MASDIYTVDPADDGIEVMLTLFFEEYPDGSSFWSPVLEVAHDIHFGKQALERVRTGA